jgi:antitoxin StbD
MSGMDSILSKRSVGISELREAPSRVFEEAGDEAIVVLNHNKPAGYILSPRLMRSFLDAMADRALSTKVAARLKTLNKARRISVDEL